MGRQVTFFLLPSDLAALESKLSDIEPFIVLHGRSESSDPRRLAAVDPAKSGDDWLYSFLVRPEDVDAVVMRHVPAQGYWTVDALHSPVIEFQRSFFDGKSIRRGRAYFVEKYFGANGALVQKPEAFRSWAQSVMGVIRRELRRRGPDYIGSDAESWLVSANGALVD